MTAQLPISTSPQPARLTSREFWLLADSGAFEGYAKAELIEGEIRVVNAVHARHARAHAVLTVELGIALRAMKSGLLLLSTPSTELSGDSIPQPDLALATSIGEKTVSGADVMLAVEISDTTLKEDLGPKAVLYAQAGIPEYWVADLNGRQILRMRQPDVAGYRRDEKTGFGLRLESATIAGLAIETSELLAI